MGHKARGRDTPEHVQRGTPPGSAELMAVLLVFPTVGVVVGVVNSSIGYGVAGLAISGVLVAPVILTLEKARSTIVRPTPQERRWLFRAVVATLVAGGTGYLEVLIGAAMTSKVRWWPMWPAATCGTLCGIGTLLVVVQAIRTKGGSR
jgi:hypothetical protein